MARPRRVRRHHCSHLNHMRGASVVPSFSSVVIALRAGSRTAWARANRPSATGKGRARRGSHEWNGRRLGFGPHVTADFSITSSNLIFHSVVPRLGAPNVSKKKKKSNEKRTGVPWHRIPRKPESRNPIVSPRSPLLPAAAGPSVPSDPSCQDCRRSLSRSLLTETTTRRSLDGVLLPWGLGPWGGGSVGRGSGTTPDPCPALLFSPVSSLRLPASSHISPD
jgi:hypothetical protein